MKRAVVWFAVAVGIALAGVAEERATDFGRAWVRSHPFTISSLLVLDTGFEHYADLGMTSALIWKGRDGIFEKAVADGLPWHYMALSNLRKSGGGYDASLLGPFKERAATFHNTYPGCEGFLVWDEPRHPAFPIMAEMMAWLRETYPEALVYSNLYSAGAPSGKYYESRDADGNYVDPPVPYGHGEYVQEFLDLCKPDLLSTDIYPFVQYETCDDVTYIHTRYFDTLRSCRERALKAGIPYWAFIQAYGYGNRYLPSESDLRMQVFSTLAYGFTGLSYFIFYAPHYGCSVLTTDGEPSGVGNVIQEVNAEVRVLGGPLRFLTSTDVRYVPGRHYDFERKDNVDNALPTGARAFDAEAATAYGIRGIEVHGLSLGRNALVGFFEDDDGGHYFMLVNLRRARGVSAEEQAMGVTIAFDESVEVVHRLSRTTGEVEPVVITDGLLETTLPGGTGDLFKIEDGTFPGEQLATGHYAPTTGANP